MLEKLAYWTILLQMPVYISQQDIPGGLHWGQEIKGIIFFIWALLQNLIPLFSGVYADRIGHKKVLSISFLIIITGYLFLGFGREFYSFLFGIILLATGSGIFKPALQGSIASTTKDSNSTLAWSIYFMLLNLSVFLGPPLSKYLKEMSWMAVFLGSAGITLLNLGTALIFIRKEQSKKIVYDRSGVLSETFRNLIQPRVIYFILIMSGFAIIYMQFYETLPNFIYDWSDTSQLASALSLPDFMIMQTARGTMISYEWLYNINAGLIILFIVIVTALITKLKIIKAIMLGILLSAAGLLFSGISMSGGFLVAGMIIYTFGEMITNPRFNDYLARIAPAGKKALFLSYLNISMALGLGGGSLLGGYSYKFFGEKSGLSSKYLLEFYGVTNINNPAGELSKLTGLNAQNLTAMLWNEYNPWICWIPFITIGLISAILMYFYFKKFDKD